MRLKPLLLVLPLICTPVFAKESNKNHYPGLNSTEVGMQNITYKESLADFAGIGDLSTEVEVSNTVISASSYTNFSEKWGFLLSSQSNATREFADDEWSVEGYGKVLSNSNKIGINELTAQGVYHLDQMTYVSFGGQLKTLGFVRSNFNPVGQAEDVNEAIRVSDRYFADSNPPQILEERFAIEEDLTFINAIAGIHYNTAFANGRKRLTWRAGAVLSTPLLYSAKNTALELQFGVETIEDSFTGYELRFNAGVSYELVSGLALTLNADYAFADHDEINTKTTDPISGNERTAAIPNIEQSSLQFTLGLLWIN